VKNELLQDAIGLIDDALIADADAANSHRRSGWIKLCAACAALALILTGTCAFLWMRDPGSGSQLPIAQNLWQKENFHAYSLSYRSSAAEALSAFDSGYGVSLLTKEQTTLPADILITKEVSITQDTAVKVEAFLAQRYAVYILDVGYPVFYDTQEDCEVDLQERILGDTTDIYLNLMASVEKVAEERNPGMIHSDVNRRLLWEYIYCLIQDLELSQVTCQSPDTSFMDYIGEYKYKDEEARSTAFWSMCWEAFVYGSEAYQNEPYSVQIMAIDPQNGWCIVNIKDIFGSSKGYQIYNIVTDTYQPMSNAGAFQLRDGYFYRFSEDGSIATLANPTGAMVSHKDMIRRYQQPTLGRTVSHYRGEELGVLFLHENAALTLDDVCASSELYISPGSKVLYYRQMPRELMNKTFKASDAVWYNRLKILKDDSAQWCFSAVTGVGEISAPIVLQGNFVRLAADETVVIMERGGVYYAYSLADGSDITGEVAGGNVEMYAHEQMAVWLEDGKLYRKNIFTDDGAKLITESDRYVLSDDGAFAFTYCREDAYVTCWNVASLESCRVEMDEQMRTQLFETAGAVLQMSFNAQENTLLLSFYIEENTSAPETDFYGLLAQLDPKDGVNEWPSDPKVITDLTVSEEVMDAFRAGADRHDHPNGVIHWYTYYPEFFDICEDGVSVFEKMGLEPPKLDINGAQYILYEKGEEKLVLTTYRFWGLYDHNIYEAGFQIHYYRGSRSYFYLFYSENARQEATGDPDAVPSIKLPVQIPPRQEAPLSVVIPTPLRPAYPDQSPEDMEQKLQSLYTKEAHSDLVPAVSEEVAVDIMKKTEALLSEKDYSRAADQIIRNTVTQMIWYYPHTQNLFAFLDPLDTQSYITEHFLKQLEQHVDAVCFPCEHKRKTGTYDPKAKQVHVALTDTPDEIALDLIRAVSLAETNADHLPYTDEANFNRALRNGYQLFSNLAMNRSQAFQTLGYMERIGWSRKDADNESYTLQIGRTSTEAGYFFRLYALTDTKTMSALFEPGGEAKIRAELVRRYGSEGADFFDRMMKGEYVPIGFDGKVEIEQCGIVELEQLFIKLFLGRMKEADTPQKMLEYLQVYRLYRKLFSFVYYTEGTSNDIWGQTVAVKLEAEFPGLDYRSADLQVVEAVLESGLIKEEIPEAYQKMLVHGMISIPKAQSFDEQREGTERLQQDAFTVAYVYYYVKDDGDGNYRCTLQYLPDGSFTFCYDAQAQRAFVFSSRITEAGKK